ncbi:Disease resistance protein [Quillaja saponaria]|uniref:Disease resistance protein n=1 Tax=Quillaja saponaria TaxID=32244 RepID=A0AAD7LP55_QUISA|nr:Disease resistance protein [Quillaja saponaria]
MVSDSDHEQRADQGGEFISVGVGSVSESITYVPMPIFSGNALFTSTWIQCFPRLKKLSLMGCGAFEVLFSLGESQSQVMGSTATLLPQLNEMKIQDFDKLTHIWRSTGIATNEIQGFHNLTTLLVVKCNSLRYVFTPSIASRLTQLQKLEITSCEGMETVVEGGLQLHFNIDAEKEEVVLFQRLSYFKLSCLHNLESICPDPYNIIWPSLKQLDVLDCSKLNICSSPACQRIAEPVGNIVAVPSSNSTSRIPSLQECGNGFLIRCLSCESTYTFSKSESNCQDAGKGKNKDKLAVTSSPGVKEKFDSIRTCRSYHLIGGLENLEELELDMCKSTEAMFEVAENSDVFKCIKKIKLCRLRKLICIWKAGSNGIIPQGCIGFENLTSLVVNECDMLRKLFPSSVQKHLVNLQEIQVSNCQMLEEIVEIRGELDKRFIISFPQLKSLNLGNLPKLSSFDQGAYDLKWPSMKKIIMTRFHDYKVFSLAVPLSPVIEAMEISFPRHSHELLPRQQVPSSKEDFGIPKHFFSTSMLQNVERLELEHWDLLEVVIQVQNLSNPISSLNCLKEMVLRNLPNLKQICMTCSPKMKVESRRGMACFPSVEIIDVQDVPNLVSFTNHHCTLELSFLQELKVRDCPKLKTFASSFPREEDIDNKDTELQAQLESDASTTIHQFNNKMVPVVQSQEFYSFGGRVDFKSIEHDRLLLESFTKCTKLKVGGCEQLSNVVPSNMIHRFQHLEELNITKCDSLVEVFESKGDVDDATDQGDAMMLYELKEMVLHQLRKLRHIWNKNHSQVLGFQKLRNLKIVGCSSLKSVLSPSMARSLVLLKVLEIRGCLNMVDIVTKEYEKSIEGRLNKADLKIIFPELLELELFDLPNLKCFHPGSYNFEFPSCKSVTIEECSMIETFSCKIVSTPQLKRVQISKGSHCLHTAFMEDLNAAIQHAYSKEIKVREGNQGEVHAVVGVPEPRVIYLDQDKDRNTVPPPFSRESMQFLTSGTSVASTSNPEIQIPPPSSRDEAEMQPTSTSSSTPPIPSTTPPLLHVHIHPTSSPPSTPTSVSTMISTQASDLGEFRGFGPIKKEYIPLLEEVISKHDPHIWTFQENRTRHFAYWAFSALGMLLHFLRSVKIKDISTEMKEEFAKLWCEAETFGFDMGWLTPYYEQVMKLGELDDAKMKEVKELEEKVLSLQARVVCLKQKLEEAEKELTEMNLELAKAKKDLTNPDSVIWF